MKLLELHSPGTTVELHPRLAVVHAPEAARRALVESLRSAVQGGHRAAGSIEVHGIILDLDRETLGLLDLDAAVEMVLEAEDVPVEAMGLAGRRDAPSDDARLQGELAGERRQQLAAAAELAATTQAELRVASEQRHAVATRLVEAEQVLEEAVASREAAERAVESATEALDEIERDEIERDETEHGVSDEIIIDDGGLGGRVAEREGEVVHEELRWADPPDLGEFEEYDAARHGADEASARAALDVLLAAEAAVVEAREEVERAARAANPARLGPGDRADLEAAHEAVIQADDRAARRFGGAAARRKLDEAKAVERTVLDRLGLDSYSDFLLRSSMGATDPSAELRLEIARSELLRAEATLTEARAVAEATPAPPPRPTPALTPASQAPATAPRAEPPIEPASVDAGGSPAVSTQSLRRRERAQEASVRLVAATRARDEAGAAESAAHAQVVSAAAELADADAKLVELAVRHDEAEQLLAQARMRADGEDHASTSRTDAASTVVPADGVNGSVRGSVLDEIDRYLLAWLAARGQHPLADPLPLVLDDVYQRVAPADLDALLLRLDHLADSLHVVYLTDDQRILRWAAGLPPERGGLSMLTGAGSPASE